MARHGYVSYYHEHGRPQRPATVPLNADGREQALALARELAVVPLDRVVVSDLVRSVETAALLTAGRGLRVETCAQLREIEPGRLADIPADAVEQAFLGAFTGAVSRETRFLAGETFGSLSDRVLTCLHDLLADRAWRHLLVVAHGGVNRVILAHALGVGLTSFGALEQDPACLNIVDVDDDGRWLVRLVNYTAYNTVKVGLELTTMERLYRQYRQPRMEHG
jgi:probable phosphoglycerate mutase